MFTRSTVFVRPALAIFVLFSACRAREARSDVRFAAAFRSFAVGERPVAVALVDLNGDGHLDLAVANDNDNSVSVLLGQGDGTFVRRANFPTGSQPFSLAAGNLDGDRNTDLAVANTSSNSVSILLGRGDGIFASGGEFATGVHPLSVAIGDLNGDRHPDLAVANLGSGTVSVLLGQGNGRFESRHDFPVGTSPVSIAIGDLNGDARSDLAVVNLSSGSVSILLGNEEGSFGPKTDFDTGSAPRNVAIGDVNGDGKPDLAVIRLTGSVAVLPGNGDGSFGSPIEVDPGIGGSGSSFLQSVVLADLDADSHLDVIADAGGRSAITVLRGNGDGSFQDAIHAATGPLPGPIAVGDVNTDGKLDLAVVSEAADAISILLGNGDGSFGARTEYPSGLGPICVASEDVNGDGRADVVSANRFSNSVSLFLAAEDGTLGPRTDYPTGALPYCVAIGHLNGDQISDVAVADFGGIFEPLGSSVSVFLGQGGGTFAPRMEFPSGAGPASLAIGDLNGDGANDLVVADHGECDAPGFTVSVLLGKGNGSFGPATEFPAGVQPISVALGDLNEDGNLDVAVANEGYCEDRTGTVSSLLGNGDGTFGPPVDFGTELLPRSLALGDLNGDGHLDVAVANPDPKTVVTFSGRGDGTFGPPSSFAAGFGPSAVAIGDLDGDRKIDLAVANQISYTVSVLLGDGRGGFEAGGDFGVGAGPASIVLGDVNADRRLDLVVANFDGNSVSVLLNQSTGDTSTMPVAIDIRPSECPNSLNVAARGMLPVAIYGGPNLDVAKLDLRSLRLQGVAPTRATGSLQDLGGPAGSPGTSCACGSRGPDGNPDRLLLFSVPALVAGLGKVVDDETRSLSLTGSLLDGTAIEAADCVRIQVPGNERRQASTPSVDAAVLWSLYPNPLPRGNRSSLTYLVPQGGAPVSIAIFSLTGQKVASLAEGVQEAGTRTVTWDGRDRDGAMLAAGAYYVRAIVGSEVRHTRVLLVH